VCWEIAAACPAPAACSGKHEHWRRPANTQRRAAEYNRTGDWRAKRFFKFFPLSGGLSRAMAGCRGFFGAKQQAASNKPQAKSKKGAHLSVRRLLIVLSSLPLSGISSQLCAAKPLGCHRREPHNNSRVADLERTCVLIGRFGRVFSTRYSAGEEGSNPFRSLHLPAIGSLCSSRVAGFPRHLWTLWSLWSLWTV
jgi:hypothetical protein